MSSVLILALGSRGPGSRHQNIETKHTIEGFIHRESKATFPCKRLGKKKEHHNGPADLFWLEFDSTMCNVFYFLMTTCRDFLLCALGSHRFAHFFIFGLVRNISLRRNFFRNIISLMFKQYLRKGESWCEEFKQKERARKLLLLVSIEQLKLSCSPCMNRLYEKI